MYEGSTWETLLYISHYKLKNVKIIIDVNNLIILGKTNDCLKLNPIEKKIKGFVKKIFVIIDSSDLFNLKLSIKERNYENSVTQKSLNHLLYEAKESCKKTLYQKKILHMIIDNYNFDNKVFTSLPKNLDCNSFSLDLSFVCISDNFVKELEKILSRYQITLSQVVYEGYVRTFLDNQNKDLFLMAKKVIEGCNSNEVIFMSKAVKNEGFFEKFFNFFK